MFLYYLLPLKFVKKKKKNWLPCKCKRIPGRRNILKDLFGEKKRIPINMKVE